MASPTVCLLLSAYDRFVARVRVSDSFGNIDGRLLNTETGEASIATSAMMLAAKASECDGYAANTPPKESPAGGVCGLAYQQSVGGA